MKKIIGIISVGVVVLGMLAVLIQHPVNVLANPFNPAQTRISEELRQEVESRFPGASVLEIGLDLDGFDLYLSNGMKMEVGFFGRIDPIIETWDGGFATTVTPPISTTPSLSEERYVDASSLPQVIVDYVAFNYPAASILVIELDRTEYNLYLDNGIELYFDLQGRFLEAEMIDEDDVDQEQTINPSQLPQGIQDFVSTNYPYTTIRLVEVYPWGYEVYLMNGLELSFTTDGQLFDVD